MQENNNISKEEIINALNEAYKNGNISANKLKQMREEFGIFQSTFTRKSISKEQRKQKRKAQKIARRKQRNKK